MLQVVNDKSNSDNNNTKKRASLIYQDVRSNLHSIIDNKNNDSNLNNEQDNINDQDEVSTIIFSGNNIDDNGNDDEHNNENFADDNNNNNNNNNCNDDGYDNVIDNNNNIIEEKQIVSINIDPPVLEISQKSFEERTAELFKATKKSHDDTVKILNKNNLKIDIIEPDDNILLNENKKDYHEDDEAQKIFESKESPINSTDISNIQVINEEELDKYNIEDNTMPIIDNLTILPPMPPIVESQPKELSAIERAKLLLSMSKMKKESSINNNNNSIPTPMKEESSIPSSFISPSMSMSQKPISYSHHQLSSSTLPSCRSELRRSSISSDNATGNNNMSSPSWNSQGPDSKNNSPIVIINKKYLNVKSKLYEPTVSFKNSNINIDKNITSSPTSAWNNNTRTIVSKEQGMAPILDNSKIKRKEFNIKSKLYNVTESFKQSQNLKKNVIIEENKIKNNNWSINNKIIDNDNVNINSKKDKRKSFPNITSNIFKTTTSYELSKAASRKPIYEKREVIIIPFKKNNNDKINSNEDQIVEKVDDVDDEEEVYY